MGEYSRCQLSASIARQGRWFWGPLSVSLLRLSFESLMEAP